VSSRRSPFGLLYLLTRRTMNQLEIILSKVGLTNGKPLLKVTLSEPSAPAAVVEQDKRLIH